VTAEMALRFACLTGGAPELYLNMQAGHDLELAKRRLQDELADIEAGRPEAAIVRLIRAVRLEQTDSLPNSDVMTLDRSCKTLLRNQPPP